MPLEFSGLAARMDELAVAAAAVELGCDAAAVRAVIDVESRGGFLPDGRPKILFERHYFSRLTGRRFDDDYPEISNPAPGGYKGGAAEYVRLAQAIELDRDAALRSASWGAFQIMGDNCRACGFDGAESFAAAMVSGEPAQLEAFVAFVKACGLADALARCDWPAFARGYNGPAYRENRYDERLAAAYRRHSPAGAEGGFANLLLRQGSRGEAVKALQLKLGVPADGIFGAKTRRAAIDFQRQHSLRPDGIVGPNTWAALEASGCPGDRLSQQPPTPA
jgi:hypothetical protein